MEIRETYRHEIKYLCTEADLRLIESKLRGICRVDAHAMDTGQYHISSIYFDDYKDTCFYENEDGTDPREKFRIRIYNGDRSRMTLECKKKRSGMTHKESCLLTEAEYAYLMGERGKLAEIMQGEKSLLKRFAMLQQARMMRPKVVVEYDRVPYVYSMGNVRITFDRNVASHRDYIRFGEKGLLQRPILPPGKHILEVKYDEFLPDYIYNVIQHPGLMQTKFSKYYLCRKYHV